MNLKALLLTQTLLASSSLCHGGTDNPAHTACIGFCRCNPITGSVLCHGDPHFTHEVVIVRLPTFPKWTRTLEIVNHHVRELPSYAFPHLPLLRSLAMRGNRLELISPFAFTQLHELRHLDLSDNDFKEIPPNLFIEMKHLKRLDLSNTKLRDLTGLNSSDFHRTATLDQLTVNGCKKLTATPNHMILPKVRELNLGNVGISRIAEDRIILRSEASFRIDTQSLRSLNLNNNTDLYIGDGFMRQFHQLHTLSICCGVSLAETELVRFNDWLNLVKLVIHSADLMWVNSKSKRITRIPDQLRYLDARNLSLTTFQLGVTYSKIEVLHLSNNRLTQLKLNTALRLTELSVAHNRLTELPSIKYPLPHMRFLDLAGNRITSVEPETLKRLPNLQTLNLAHNYVHTFSPPLLSQLQHLENLNLAHNYIQSITFTHLPSVRSISLANNWLNSELGEPLQLRDLSDAPRLTHFDVSNNPDLLSTTRHCTATSYQCWPNWMGHMFRLSKLTYLNLSNTSLYAWPLKEFLLLVNLQILDASFNYLTVDTLEFPWNNSKVSLSHQARIDTLLLTGNNISSLPLRFANRLKNYAKFVDLRLNPFECDCELPEALLALANNLTTSHYDCYSRETDTSMPMYMYVNSRRLWCREQISVLTAVLILMSVLIPCFCSLCCSMICLRKLRTRRRRRYNAADQITHSDHSYTLLSRMSPTSEESPVDL